MPPSTHGFPQDKIDRYLKVKARMDRGEGAERDVAARLLAKLVTENPGIDVAAQAAEARSAAEKALWDAMRRRGFPGDAGSTPFTPPQSATKTQRKFFQAFKWAMDKLVDGFDPSEILDAVEEAAGFPIEGRADRKPPVKKEEPSMSTQADRIRSLLEREGDLVVEFLLTEEDANRVEKDPQAVVVPAAVRVELEIPWAAVDRLGKTKGNAAVLSDWILAAIEKATEEASG